MTTTTPRRAGQPTLDPTGEPAARVTVTMTKAHRTYAAMIGGKVSVGVRLALDFYKEMHLELKEQEKV